MAVVVHYLYPGLAGGRDSDWRSGLIGNGRESPFWLKRVVGTKLGPCLAAVTGREWCTEADDFGRNKLLFCFDPVAELFWSLVCITDSHLQKQTHLTALQRCLARGAHASFIRGLEAGSDEDQTCEADRKHNSWKSSSCKRVCRFCGYTPAGIGCLL